MRNSINPPPHSFFSTMGLLSFTPSLLLRPRVHKSSARTSPSLPPHFLSPSPPPILPVRILYAPATRSSSSSPHIPCFASSSNAGTLLHDACATTVVLAGAYSLILFFDSLTNQKLIQQNLSRKLVHILSGLLFAVCWPIFSNSTEARYFASFVPLVNCLRLLIHGLSLATDEGLIKSVTREGNPEELLRGPLYYILILILCTLIFWRESPVGVISLAMMCGGDGVADIMGRRFGSTKLPYNQHKSWAGSIAMFICGLLASVGMLYYYSALGYFHLEWVSTVQRVALVALVATVVESLPTTQVVDDNISVPLASIVAAYLTFRF